VNNLNIKIVAVVAAVAILLLGGGLFLYSKSKPQPSVQPSPSASATQNPSAMQSLSEILSMGKTQKCTFSYDGASGGKTEGTVYLAGDKMRGDFKVTTSGKVSEFSLIRVGDTNYIWGTGLPGGIKMTLSAQGLAGNTQVQQYVNADQKADYKCGAWTPDNTRFSPPTEVKFTDYSSMMPKSNASPAPGGTNSGGSSQCGACNYLTGDSKMACIMQYNCAQSQ
jgi:hypothetical protein